MKGEKGNIIIAAVAALAVCIAVQTCHHRPADPVVVTRTVRDTVRLTDTVIRNHTTVRSVKLYDTAVVIVRDTVRDTVYIQLPIEYKELRYSRPTDSVSLTAHILYHGYKAAIDSVALTCGLVRKSLSGDGRELKARHPSGGWGQFAGVAIQAGYGLTATDMNLAFPLTIQPAPYIGIGVCYGWGWHW